MSRSTNKIGGFIFTALLALSVIAPQVEAYEDEEYEYFVRLLGGYTYSAPETEPAGYEAIGYHYGFQLFERQSEYNSAGIEFAGGVLYTEDSGDYEVSTVGLILERKFMREYLATIGAVGYFGAGDEDFDGAIFGMRIGIGYETYISSYSFMTLLYRYDYIFAAEGITSSNFSLGVGVDF